ncbi:uncharacterized protein EV422DRAFT_506839 [Fimicolochytrium jonesii]|uniref:uncharacterized protein n=1 Tax=Fimicolochytrium jonesii TaxID=1396493 RepID=UPI0022FEF59B|nr:uncharacterized protein EV422DRAFT_506839 [Fimicolochytrium jonesii]KAI8820103.1 hypothetical protein EV422DRAFT_506839 [Fimicolochytrium jonesii]
MDSSGSTQLAIHTFNSVSSEGGQAFTLPRDKVIQPYACLHPDRQRQRELSRTNGKRDREDIIERDPKRARKGESPRVAPGDKPTQKAGGPVDVTDVDQTPDFGHDLALDVDVEVKREREQDEEVGAGEWAEDGSAAGGKVSSVLGISTEPPAALSDTVAPTLLDITHQSHAFEIPTNKPPSLGLNPPSPTVSTPLSLATQLNATLKSRNAYLESKCLQLGDLLKSSNKLIRAMKSDIEAAKAVVEQVVKAKDVMEKVVCELPDVGGLLVDVKGEVKEEGVVLVEGI